MNARALIPVVALGTFVAGAWWLLRPPELQEPPASNGAAARVSEAPSQRSAMPEKLSASSVLAIDPRASSRKVATPVRSTLMREFLAAKQYRALYDRLKTSAEGTTAEGAYVLYEIANRCATITDRPARRTFGNAAKPLDQRRDEFLAALQSTDPMREKRVAAFEEVNTNRCLGFEGISLTQADLGKMLADAVSLGDPKARALAIEQEINAARRGRWDQGTLNESQIDGLKQAIGTRDPAAMVTAGRLLSTSYGDLTMRLGPDGQVVEPRAMLNAWQILACDYGYPCGETNDRVLQACAYQAHCDAQSLPDYLHYYGSSPHDSQLIAQYQGILRTAVETGDWSQLNLVRGPRPPGAPRYPFAPPR
jgi:hypothetical protein